MVDSIEPSETLPCTVSSPLLGVGGRVLGEGVRHGGTGPREDEGARLCCGAVYSNGQGLAGAHTLRLDLRILWLALHNTHYTTSPAKYSQYRAPLILAVTSGRHVLQPIPQRNTRDRGAI